MIEMARKKRIKMLSSIKFGLPSFTYVLRKEGYGNMYSVKMRDVKITKRKK